MGKWLYILQLKIHLPRVTRHFANGLKLVCEHKCSRHGLHLRQSLNPSVLDENDNRLHVVGNMLVLLKIIYVNLTICEQVNIFVVGDEMERVLELISRCFAFQVFFFEKLFSFDCFSLVFLHSFQSFSFCAASHSSVLKL